MVDITVRTVYEAPRELVAGVAGDPAQAPRWQSSVQEVRWHAEPVVTLGVRLDLVTHFLKRELSYTYEVVDWIPGERLVLRTDQGPVPMELTYIWWDEDDEQETGQPRTGMSLRQVGRPRGLTTLGTGAVSLGLKRAMRRDLERLREVLTYEQRAARDQDWEQAPEH